MGKRTSTSRRPRPTGKQPKKATVTTTPPLVSSARSTETPTTSLRGSPRTLPVVCAHIGSHFSVGVGRTLRPSERKLLGEDRSSARTTATPRPASSRRRSTPPARASQRARWGGDEVKGEQEKVDKEDDALSACKAKLKTKEGEVRSLERELKRRTQDWRKEEKRLKSSVKRKEKALHDIRASFEKETVAAKLDLQRAEEKNEQLEVLLKEKDVALVPGAPGGVSVRWVLEQLEEQYTCSLCFEVMALPYELNHGRCGHAFCALCALKWCFAAVHWDCGYWHDTLECPLCRAEMPFVPDQLPRLMSSFPFVPNRLADNTIRSYLDILKDAAESRSSNPKPAGLGGASRGKKEMTNLITNWTSWDGQQFRDLKERLEVG
ncbi:uncharacterized protein BXZ73DRAFT_75353 [Epithele typhae]|uniref:uncharacterized protein n=1 Tax=Epithele typhae TaxID=378194 RepID=UPI0020072298|nr:uncharacterized protein BXZ73DRAFT_75353 [Epithele typhae]KAH9940810.1 hypothetical protein BXZ73DRAFT_75353 [Epithele typhae]